MKRSFPILFIILISQIFALSATGESKLEYQNRFRMMIDYAVRSNEYIRRHLGDKHLVSYAHEMATKNAQFAERMTAPPSYASLHPHFLLVLENIERSFFYAAQGKQKRYRHHQKLVRKELSLLETLARRTNLELYLWDRGF